MIFMGKQILILSPAFPPSIGGVETHLKDLADYMNDRNYDVSVVTFDPQLIDLNIAKAPRTELTKRLSVFRIPWFGKGFFSS